jgi:MoxR-like ATPase
MSYPVYRGDGQKRPREGPVTVPVSRRAALMQPEKYLADPGLVQACNVALRLGQPLLLTGEPGTGKTLFAYSLAWEFGLGEPLKFETKSNSMAADLFYTYDTLRRFQEAQSGAPPRPPFDYLTYQALGLAILYSRELSDVSELLPPGFQHPGKKQSVVLIDEVDKAPRDFPNDILNELELLYFRIPELGNLKVEADATLQPIIIITSNSEKDLPDAFLRRCVYYNIPFPDRERLEAIIANRLGLYSANSSAFVSAALDLFEQLRAAGSGLRKKPATAELLGWILALQSLSDESDNLLAAPELVLGTLSSLVKTADDQEQATVIAKRWLDSRKR